MEIADFKNMKKLIFLLLIAIMLISCNQQHCGILISSSMNGVDTVKYSVEILHRGKITTYVIDSIEYNNIHHGNFNKKYCTNGTIKDNK